MRRHSSGSEAFAGGGSYGALRLGRSGSSTPALANLGAAPAPELRIHAYPSSSSGGGRWRSASASAVMPGTYLGAPLGLPGAGVSLLTGASGAFGGAPSRDYMFDASSAAAVSFGSIFSSAVASSTPAPHPDEVLSGSETPRFLASSSRGLSHAHAHTHASSHRHHHLAASGVSGGRGGAGVSGEEGDEVDSEEDSPVEEEEDEEMAVRRRLRRRRHKLERERERQAYAAGVEFHGGTDEERSYDGAASESE